MFSGAFENYYFNGNYGLLSVQYKLSSITNICIKMLITTKNYLHFSQLKMSQRWGSEALTMEVNMHANIILVWNKFTNFTTLKSFMTLISSINESHSLVHASSGFFFHFFFVVNEGWVEIIFVLINIMPEMVSNDLTAEFLLFFRDHFPRLFRDIPNFLKAEINDN